MYRCDGEHQRAGPVSIPAPIRRELGSEAGIPLLPTSKTAGVLEAREHLICRIQASATAE